MADISNDEDNDRREFLKRAGRFAVVTPPTVTFLLSTSLTSKAIAGSSGRSSRSGKRGNWLFGWSRGKGHKHGHGS